MHMKRYSMPKTWPLSVKESIWVGRPMPGPHGKDSCITLGIIVRDVLKYAEGMKEAKRLIKAGDIMVNKKVRKEERFPVGLMDTIEIPKANDYFRVSVNSNGLVLEKIKAENSDKKLCKITRKSMMHGGRCQLGLHNGRSIIVSGAKSYSNGDSLLLHLPDQKILKHFKLEKNAQALIVDGKNRGMKGRIKEIKERKSMQEKATIIIDVKGNEIETLKKYVMVGEAS